MKVYTGDLEADGFLDEATRVWCGVFKDRKTGKVVAFYPGSHDDYIKAMLEFLDTVDVLIMHNGIKYDLPLLRKLYGYDYKGIKIDTLIWSRMQRPDRRLPPGCTRSSGPHSIEAWGIRLGKNKQEHDDWSHFSELMLKRCKSDVEIQHLLYDVLKKEGAGEGWTEALKLTFELFDVIQRQEEYGWYVDREHIDKSLRMLTHWIDRIDSAVQSYLPIIVDIYEKKDKEGNYSHVKKPFKKDGSHSLSVTNWFSRFNSGVPDYVSGPFSRVNFRRVALNSNSETKQFLLKLGWEPKEWNSNNEGKRTSPKLSKDDPFVGVQGSLGRLIARRVQCRQKLSVIEGWVDAIRPDGRIPSIVAGLAVTARARHNVIANVPRADSFFGKWMRKIFIAKPGWDLVGTDATACQIRMLAARMDDEEYTKFVLSGKDMHQYHADRGGMPNRIVAKTTFYGVIFGSGDLKTAKSSGMKTAEEGKQVKDRLFEGIPKLKETIIRLSEEWSETAIRTYDPKTGRMYLRDGFIRGLDGRPITIDSEHKVLVGALQSDEAIMMTRAYVQFNKWMQERGYKWYEDYGIVCWYHDEFNVECRPEISKVVASLAEEAIAWAGRFYNIACEQAGSATIGKSWYEVH